MLFHSSTFLVFFLIVFAVYWALPHHRARMIWLLLASAVFYGSWNPWLILLICFSAAVDYAVALRLQRVQAPLARRLLLVLSVGTNLGLLIFFKYVNFFLDQVALLTGVAPGRLGLNIVLPLGISFYTFETISYIVDVYRGRIQPVRSPLDYALYILFFPHLLAGPIVRPHEFLPQLQRRKRFSWLRAQVGVRLFLVGAFKKAVLADHLAAVVDPVFGTPLDYGSAAAWLAILGYAAQVYCDFSGYSDMALGLAHLLGFHLPVNFNLPYFAGNVAELWRRWHISLSTWLRDYLFIPLGGSKGGTWATCRNLVITMTLGGLWHGAAWPFVVWGLFHGVLLAAHRVIPWPGWLARPWARPLAVAATFTCFCIGLAIFRCQTLGEGAGYLARMFWPIAGAALEPASVLVVLLASGAVFAGHLAGTFLDLKRLERRAPELALGAALAGVLLLALIALPESGAGFIYFQF